MRLIAVLLAATLGACSTPFEVEIPPQEPRLVVASLFSADSVLTLRVSQSEPIFLPRNPGVADVTNARISIYEDGTLVGNAPYVQNQLRYVSSVRPRIGRTYRVRVEADGFAPVEAQDTVPLPRPFTVELAQGPEPSSGFDRIEQATVRFSDPAGPDRYALYGLIERSFPGRDATPQVFPLLFTSSDPALADGNLESLITETNDSFYFRAFFSDRPFDGSAVTIQIGARRLRDEPGVETEIRERLRLAVVSDTYYRYQRALGQADTPLADVTRLPSNVEGGYGIFAAFAASEQVLPQ